MRRNVFGCRIGNEVKVDVEIKINARYISNIKKQQRVYAQYNELKVKKCTKLGIFSICKLVRSVILCSKSWLR